MANLQHEANWKIIHLQGPLSKYLSWLGKARKQLLSKTWTKLSIFVWSPTIVSLQLPLSMQVLAPISTWLPTLTLCIWGFLVMFPFSSTKNPNPSCPIQAPFWIMHESPNVQLVTATLYPIFVDWPTVTAGPIIVPDPICTFSLITHFEWTTAPISMIAVGSIQADLWKIPPPLCHLSYSKLFVVTLSAYYKWSGHNKLIKQLPQIEYIVGKLNTAKLEYNQNLIF